MHIIFSNEGQYYTYGLYIAIDSDSSIVVRLLEVCGCTVLASTFHAIMMCASLHNLAHQKSLTITNVII